LKYHELPVLGIPGAEAAQTLQPAHLQGLTKLYLSREPGQGGEAFVAGLRRRLRAIGWRGQALVFSSDGAKDPNELHKRNPEGFRAAFQAALDRAEPLTPTLQTYTAAELMDMTLPEPRWAVPDILTEGVPIFAGRPKIGKCRLTLALGLGIAAGGKATGSIDVEAGEVLYAALEDNPRRIRDRLKSLRSRARWRPNAYISSIASPDSMRA
jgi:AAA domain